jgi:hypothetical protein
MRPPSRRPNLKRQAEEGLATRLRVHGLSQGTTEEDYNKRLAVRARRHHAA